MESTLELFRDVEALMGGECQCGGNGLECNEECCGEEAIGDLGGYCQKETLTRLKEVLEEYEKLLNKIPCPEGHADTYKYDSPEYGLMLMCNTCEDGYELVEGEG